MMYHQLIQFQTIIPKSYELPCQLYLPPDYGNAPERTWPMILSLHGAAARGTNPELVLQSELPATIEAGVEYPFIVISPQCPAETWWSDHLPALDLLLKDVSDHYRVDQRRTAVTGVSMGAFGVWHLGATYPNRFSALVPISGGAAWFHGFPQRARVLQDTAVWIFHGEVDPIMPLREATVLADEVKAAGQTPRFTIIPEGGHDIWKQVYRMPELISWLENQKRAG